MNPVLAKLIAVSDAVRILLTRTANATAPAIGKVSFALDDGNAIFDYIEADSPQAAVIVDDRIDEQVGRLLQFPEMGRIGRIEGTRELVIQNTPYYPFLFSSGGKSPIHLP
jgi:plasmid stabilization system protein ParE